MDDVDSSGSAAAMPLYIQHQGSTVGMDGKRLVIRKNGDVLHEARLIDVDHVGLLGNVQMTTQALKALAERDIPVLYMSRGGRLQAVLSGPGHKHGELRQAQHRIVLAPKRHLTWARTMVAGKIDNARTLLRRNGKSRQDVAGALLRLRRAKNRALRAQSPKHLLGVEGSAARVYFQSFPLMLTPQARKEWPFTGRNRRPPRDAMNSLLSFTYALLVKDAFNAVVAVGLDPYVGVYHGTKYGRPALALDLAEEFRPLLADSVVLRLVNNDAIRRDQFEQRDGGVFLTDKGRTTVIEAYESRLQQKVVHPGFNRTVPYRSVIALQARLLARSFLEGEQPYQAFTTR